MYAQPRVERIAERDLRPRVGLLLDLMDEPAQDALGFLLVSRRRGEPVRLASHRVDPGVDQHLEGPAPLANVPAWSASGSRPGHVRIAVDDTTVDIDQLPRGRMTLQPPETLA